MWLMVKDNAKGRLRLFANGQVDFAVGDRIGGLTVSVVVGIQYE
jgi:hypothetical protein